MNTSNARLVVGLLLLVGGVATLVRVCDSRGDALHERRAGEPPPPPPPPETPPESPSFDWASSCPGWVPSIPEAVDPNYGPRVDDAVPFVRAEIRRLIATGRSMHELRDRAETNLDAVAALACEQRVNQSQANRLVAYINSSRLELNVRMSEREAALGMREDLSDSEFEHLEAVITADPEVRAVEASIAQLDALTPAAQALFYCVDGEAHPVAEPHCREAERLSRTRGEP